MARIEIARIAANAAALASAVLMLGAVVTAPGPGADAPQAPPRPTSSAEPPAGTLLIASARIQDPRFHHAVVLLLRHDGDGAFGIVVNRPLGRRPIKSLLDAAGDSDSDADRDFGGTITVVAGGPVEPRLGFIVHSADYRRDETMAVDGKVAMTASKAALRDIGRGRGPKQYFFAFGYAGWGAGQLEGELARQDWFTAGDDPALLFDEDREAMWDKALARRGQDL